MHTIKALLLAAGLGTRLQPLTEIWPKCLIPIHQRPLLEYWLHAMQKNQIQDVIVNTHYLHQIVEVFLAQNQYQSIHSSYEENLLGTAGTLKKHSSFFKGNTVFLAHADNWCHCDWEDFIHFHEKHRPSHTLMTMMTFRTTTPESCGIVQLDHQGVVQQFYEKVEHPPGNLANGAVFLLEPEILDWITEHSYFDFSKEVIPHFLGKIATWENTTCLLDIGTLHALKKAESTPYHSLPSCRDNEWQKEFLHHPIHSLVEKTLREQ